MRAIFFFLEPERGCREITCFSPDFHKKKSPAEFRAIWHGLFCGRFLFLHCLHFHLKFPMYKHREWLHGNGDRKHPLPYMRNNHRYTRYPFCFEAASCDLPCRHTQRRSVRKLHSSQNRVLLPHKRWLPQNSNSF